VEKAGAGAPGSLWVWAAHKLGSQSVMSTIAQIDLNSVLLSPVPPVELAGIASPVG
jgi:hypothetical protein